MSGIWAGGAQFHGPITGARGRAITSGKDDESIGSLFLDFEAVFERAENAEHWLNVSQWWFTIADALAEDSRYANFAAVENRQVLSNNRAPERCIRQRFL